MFHFLDVVIMRIRLVACLLFAFQSCFSQFTISGCIRDVSSGLSIPSVKVSLVDIGLEALTDSVGNYQIQNIPSGTYQLTISQENYEFVDLETVINSDMIEVNYLLKKKLLGIPALIGPGSEYFIMNEVLVEATRASQRSPISYTELTSKELAPLNTGQDMPYLLRFTPSLIATSDAGNGIGYTGLWIRGSDPSRINVTINGVPLNDPESQQVFWVNTPDFGSSVNNIQIQRGVGTSANGAASFGGSIKMETRGVRNEAYAETNNAFGSFNTWKNNVSFGTGLLKNHFIVEGRLSRIASDGYIDRASSDLKSYFLEGNYLTERTTVKLLVFGGTEKTYQSWNGTPWEILNGTQEDRLNYAIRNGLNDAQTSNLTSSSRTYNFYQYENQVDNYGQDHAQLHLSHTFKNNWRLNAAAHYTHGEGYFEEFKTDARYEDYGLRPLAFDSALLIESTDVIRRRWLKNDFYGGVFSLTRNNGQWESVLGGGWNEYRGNHFGELVWLQFAGTNFIGDEYYRGKSLKQDANVYWKNVFTVKTKLDIYWDLQARMVNYTTSGTDNDLRAYTIDDALLFFNPKLGVNYRIKKDKRVYVSAAVGNKEPNRNDYVDAADVTKVKAEQMLDLEAGYQLKKEKWSIGMNLYDMIYKNQLVLTGELNDVGAPLRANAANSFRRGIELEGTWNFLKGFNLATNLTLSQNKILKFDEVLYDYTTDFDIINITHEGKDISFSPSIIGAAQLSYRYEADKNYPNRDAMEFAWMTKYVSKQYMDNTQNEATSLPAYLVNDFRFTYELTLRNHHIFTINATVNNVLNELYVSNGYTYSYVYETRITERFYYPQAGRSVMLGLGIKL